MKAQLLLTVLIAATFLLPSVSAIEILRDDEVYTIFYDEELFEEVKPGIVGEQPEIIYWRFMQEQSNVDETYLVMLLFWEYQHHYIVPHQYDWEWYIVVFDSNGYALRAAYPEWHYIIGRDFDVRLYNETHSFINIGVDNHPVTVYENNTFGSSIPEALNYTGIDTERLDSTILKKAAEDVGFDEGLANEPTLFFDKGIVLYERYSAFRDWKRSFMVYIDRKLDWIDYSS